MTTAKMWVRTACAIDLLYTGYWWLWEPRTRGVLNPWRHYFTTVAIMATDITIIRRLR